MSNEQREDILKRHEKLLWWMREQERFAFIAELRADYIFEDQQSCVHEIFSAKPIFTSDLPQHLSEAL